MPRFKLFVWPLIVIAGVLFLTNYSVVEAKVPTPQIYQVVPSQDNPYRPWVTGLTPNQVEVEVLVDEKPMGFAKVVKDESGTASFGWSPQQDLSLGFHQFRVRGRFGNEYSEPGAILGFIIKPPTPAPVLMEPEQFDDYILIKGLVKNDLSVKVYIDGWLAADFAVPNHPSGTTNFWFKARGLLNGLHEVYVVAYDKSGKLSKKSEIKSFKTEQQKLTKGEGGVQEETVSEETVSKAEVVDQPAEGEVEIVNPEQSEAEVSVVAEAEEGTVTITDEEDAEGQVSSIEEVSEGGLIEDGIGGSDFDKEKKNRVIGLIILAVMVVILLLWYWIEKKKEAVSVTAKNSENKKTEERAPSSASDDSKKDGLGL